MKHLSSTLLHTAWTQSEKIILDDALAYVENYQGQNFISDISSWLFQVLKIDYILLATFANPSEKFLSSTILLCKGKRITHDIFKLDNTPFGTTLENDFCYYPFGLQNIFPDDEVLGFLEVESFLGISLYNQLEEPMGLIALMHNRIIEGGGFVEALLNAVIPQIEKELSYPVYNQNVSV